MNQTLSYEAYRPLINKFSWKVLRRLYAAGARGVEIEDVRQELSIAWIKAAERWNPEGNVPFGPYLMNGMKHVINHWCQKEIGASQFAPYSIDKHVGEDDADSFQEVIPSKDKPLDQALIEKDIYEKIMGTLSPRAQTFVKLLNDPPEEVVKVFNALRAKAEYSRSRGYSTFVPRSIPASLIFDLMLADRVERAEIRREIEDKCKGWSAYE